MLDKRCPQPAVERERYDFTKVAAQMEWTKLFLQKFRFYRVIMCESVSGLELNSTFEPLLQNFRKNTTREIYLFPPVVLKIETNLHDDTEFA